MNKKNNQKGISLVIALIMTTLLLSISMSIGSIIVRQLRITNTTTNSQSAFYAADSALECALYWDTKTDGTIDEANSFPNAVFGTTTSYPPDNTGNPIKCGDSTSNPFSFTKTANDPSNAIATTTFYLDYGDTCAYVQVVKNPNRTIISTRGYNTVMNSTDKKCDLTDAANRRLVERGLIFRH